MSYRRYKGPTSIYGENFRKAVDLVKQPLHIKKGIHDVSQKIY